MAGMTSERLHLTPDGNWLELRKPVTAPQRGPGCFLDRDGVLIEDKGYVDRPEDVELCAGARELLAAVAARGWRGVIVTNQSGIARGLHGWADFARVQAAMFRALGAAGDVVEAVLACPFYPDHAWRKPAPGMVLAAAELLPIDLERSWMIGDRGTDMACAEAAGLAGGILLASSKAAGGSRSEGHARFQSLGARSLAEAARLVAELA